MSHTDPTAEHIKGAKEPSAWAHWVGRGGLGLHRMSSLITWSIQGKGRVLIRPIIALLQICGVLVGDSTEGIMVLEGAEEEEEPQIVQSPQRGHHH